jgi:hypothetical protein
MTMLAALLVICTLIAATTAALLRADEPEAFDQRLPLSDRRRAECLAPELVAIAPPWMSDAERRAWVAERARAHS